MKKLVIGILAHVDAGKTTLSEALLYTTGTIRKPGRVDWRNTYLDTHDLERERGITIFSKQAVLETETMHVTLLDTPGHVDFSAETERTLSVLDAAILVISGSEGVQAHTETLWKLLERYHVPTFVFVTKMDLTGADRGAVLADLEAHLSPACADFSEETEALWERVALCDETVLEQYMENGRVGADSIAALVQERKLFPCCFGSGLRLEGVEHLLGLLEQYARPQPQKPAFGARVYKIGRDPSGSRLTYLKVTGGTLAVRQTVSYTPVGADAPLDEKITAIRLYSGAKFTTPEAVEAGDVCAVIGLSATYAGQGLGVESASEQPYLEPVLHYRMSFPKGTDMRKTLLQCKELEEEEPLLHIFWNERFGEIQAQVMGDVQTEILTSLLQSRFGLDVQFDEGRILYKETLTKPVEGVGHFEPLRHYAEVHLLLEPLPAGSGLVFDTACPENFLDRNWQRLILTHLEEKQHLGTLTGSPVTDMKITLTAGRAHLKHTVGGDFREATYRAVRHGLMTARAQGACVLLEPYYAFRLEVPGETVGRAIADILARDGTYEEAETTPGTSVLTGRAPVSTMADYAREVASYTHGKGRFSCRVEGYFPCHNAAEVLAKTAYDPEADVENTPDSVFCSHGSGTVIPWTAVTDYMHLEGIAPEQLAAFGGMSDTPPEPIRPKVLDKNVRVDEKELEAIMEREFGPIRRKVYGKAKNPVTTEAALLPRRKSLYIIDGYNVIFAWEELAALAETDLEAARTALCDLLADYQAFTARDIIVVFDAYNVKGAAERKFAYHGLHVVYTKEGELGDTYIEKLTAAIGQDFSVRVVTSDGLIQLQAVRSGVLRLSAREFRTEMLAVDAEIHEILEKLKTK